MNCRDCKYNDGSVYTSLPPLYKCTFTNEMHLGGHECDLDLVPVIRCKDCKYFLGGMPVPNSGIGWCTCRLVSEKDYCSCGERK